MFVLFGFDHSFGLETKRSLRTHHVQNNCTHVNYKRSSCCSASKMLAEHKINSLLPSLTLKQTHHGCQRDWLPWLIPTTVVLTTMMLSALTQMMWWLLSQELKAAICLNRFILTPAMTKRYCFCWVLASITTTNPCFPSNKSRGLSFRRLFCVLATTSSYTKSSGVQMCLISILFHAQVTGLRSRQWTGLNETLCEMRWAFNF